MTLTANESTANRCADMVKRLVRYISLPQRLLRSYYSRVLGEDVSEARTRAMTEAQLAFFAVTLPADYPLAMRVLACVWFVVAVKKLKANGQSTDTHPNPPKGRELD